MSEKFNFSGSTSPITCHAWNQDRSQIAISPNNNEVHIYKKAGNGWTLQDKLIQHDMMVKSIDWAPKTNRLVTCSVDRNAYVWTLDNSGKWKPELVLLRMDRAATFVRWSPLENKFAVCSGHKLVAICYYEESNKWWVSKHIKKPFKSTVTSLDWHPNNVLIATGSTDFRVRVFSAYIKDADAEPKPTAWGSKMTLGTLMVEIKNSSNGGGWVHSVSFSGDGNKIAWVSHDSSVNVADVQNPQSFIKLKTKFTPFTHVLWVSPKTFVAAGHDCYPTVFEIKENKIVNSGKFSQTTDRAQSSNSAMERFRRLDNTASVTDNDKFLNSVHQNSITTIRLFDGDRSNAKKISTSGVDGLMVIWDMAKVQKI